MNEAITPQPVADENTRRLLSIPDVAHRLCVGRTSVYALISSGDLEVVHIGRSVRVPVAAIDEFVARKRDEQRRVSCKSNARP
jgi:excisionase family DNA binding protein